MWRTLFFAVLAIVGGMCLALQSSVNARMRDVLRGSPWGAAMVSVVVSSIILAVLAVAAGQGRQVAHGLGHGPWWAYLGGVLGVVFLVTSLVAVTQMGATVTYIAVTLGGTVSAAVADRFGLFGLSQIHLGGQRIAAIALMAGALILLLHETVSRGTSGG